MEKHHQIVILRPRAHVFAYLGNSENDAKWRAEINESHITTPLPLGVGSRFTQKIKVLGRVEQQIEVVYTAYTPDSHFAYDSITTVAKLHVDYIFAEIENGTQIDTHLTLDVWGIAKIAESLFSASLDKDVVDNLVRLKYLFEETNLII